MKTLKDIKVIEFNGNKFKFLFPDNYFYYSCEDCQINCCTRNDKILLHKNFKSDYSSFFKSNHKILNLGVCPELKKDGKCKIELDKGKFAKPDICNIFPYHILGKYNDIYLVSVDFSVCPLKPIGITQISQKNFFKQTQNINLSFYNFNDKYILGKHKNFKYSENNTLWLQWNKYYNKNYKLPKSNYFIDGFENSILNNNNLYLELETDEKIALVYLISLYEDISNKNIDTYTFLKLVNELYSTIKLLTMFNQKSVFLLMLSSPFISHFFIIAILLSFIFVIK